MDILFQLNFLSLTGSYGRQLKKNRVKYWKWEYMISLAQIYIDQNNCRI